MGDTKTNGRGRQRELGDALTAALEEQEGAESHRRRQGQARHGSAEAADRPRPLEFDGNGFPVPQPTPSYVARVTRLLS